LAIGLAFRDSTQLGLVVALAVLAHDFADGMNVVTLTMAGGRGARTARVVLALDAVAPVAGGILGSFTSLPDMVLGALLGFFAGVFLAIGASHLLPEAQHQAPGASRSLVLLAAVGGLIVLFVRNALG
jgi:zinc transporter ZupT